MTGPTKILRAGSAFLFRAGTRLFLLAAAFASPLFAQPASTNLWPKPLMGFNNFYKTGAYNLTEAYMSNAAASMINLGLRDAGYRYIVMDAGVFTNRDANGNLVETGAFPSGLTNFVRWLHTNGFKAGIWQENTPEEIHFLHSTSSSLTNHNKYLARDIQSFANWEFDYIKFDTDPADQKQEDMTAIRDLITATGRPMFLHGATTNYVPWMSQTMNSWRTIFNGDIGGGAGLYRLYTLLDYAFLFPDAEGPDHFWSFDLTSALAPGSGFEVHLTGAAMWSAELILANIDNPDFWPYYTNQTFLEINQDPALAPPAKAYSNNLAEIWVKPLGTRSPLATTKAVALFNRNFFPTNITVWMTNVFASGVTNGMLRDVWHQTNSFVTNSFTFTVAQQNAALFKLDAIAPPPVTVAASLTNGSLQLTWNSPSGTVYRIVASTNLSLTNWTDISGGITATGTATFWTDAGLSNNPWRYYRVRSP